LDGRFEVPSDTIKDRRIVVDVEGTLPPVGGSFLLCFLASITSELRIICAKEEKHMTQEQ